MGCCCCSPPYVKLKSTAISLFVFCLIGKLEEKKKLYKSVLSDFVEYNELLPTTDPKQLWLL